ncbi:uroporphyrinogen-III synthase [Colwellia hornerae]|uniref:Uroporphyrinogen-III synthase n=1 Tax=Colwellia hornerae TaxID=89402 RepID=A0A5C6Q463_9GAMM|nr:uroporphyrinogen-III synthase [Colwellia hornerae]TWX58443.1 uroporphyrinogen-III synthase [Colwellia hornerae]TWX58679.1 uroporphyrinogen-III synthase [Colwellia hornerae]TWX63579.1 uroporphyrinogen-III synthase [Colwellia hornerae]
MLSSNTQVLITRPEKAGRALAQQLKSIGIDSHCQPFFDYQALASKTTTEKLVKQYPQATVIFVSVAAVEFAHRAVHFSQWQQKRVIAIGSATLAALKSRGLNAVSPELHTSEGLLTLNILDEEMISGETIIIVRGDGGREHIAEQLSLRSAKVCYLESYKKVWQPITQKHVQQWRNQRINCIVITSNALLESIVHLIKNSESYWQTNCLWVVASKRIAAQAKQLGLLNIINANGANDQAMLSAITSYGKNND